MEGRRGEISRLDNAVGVTGGSARAAAGAAAAAGEGVKDVGGL